MSVLYHEGKPMDITQARVCRCAHFALFSKRNRISPMNHSVCNAS